MFLLFLGFVNCPWLVKCRVKRDTVCFRFCVCGKEFVISRSRLDWIRMVGSVELCLHYCNVDFNYCDFWRAWSVAYNLAVMGYLRRHLRVPVDFEWKFMEKWCKNRDSGAVK